MESLKIVLLCVAAAIVFGIGHDQVTARVCVEYFTVGHPPVLGSTTNPTLLGLWWGIVATWWVGVLLGVPAAALARIGSRPKIGWRELRWPITLLMVLLAISASFAGFVAYVNGGLNEYYFYRNSADVQHRANFVAAATAHNTAYGVGFVGGVLIWGWIWWKRGRAERRILLAEMDRLRRENRELVEKLRRDSGR